MPDNRQNIGDSFEEDVAGLLHLLGFNVERNRWRAGRQTDLVARREVFPERHEYLVECKGWSNDVPMSVVTDMHARVDAVRRTESPDVKGWIITKKGFALNAKEHAHTLGIQCSTYEEILDRLINFRPYVNRFIEDIENLAGKYLDVNGRPTQQPMIDLMLRCDLYHYYVPIDILENKLSPTSDKTLKRVTTVRRPALEFVLEWLGDNKQNHLTVLGDFGSGKSSFVIYLTYILAKRYLDEKDSFSRVPLLIPLRDYYKRLNIESLVTNLLVNEYQLQGNWPIFKRFLESGRILLIFDGFDEMVTRSSPHDTVENLREICKLALPNTKTILTCRTHYFRDQREVDETFGIQTHSPNPLMEQIKSRQNFQIIEVAPFSDDQVAEFLKKRIGESEAQNVFKRMQATYNLSDLSKRPVLCDMIVKTLPQLLRKGEVINPAQLYDAYTSHWIDTDDWRSIMTAKGKRLLMEELACQMFFQPTGKEAQSIHYAQLPTPKQEFFKHTMKHDPKAYDLYDHDTRTCTFLNRDADGNYSFIHKSFQEFFVACELRNEINKGDINLILKFEENHRSNEVMSFLRGLRPEPNAINDVLIKMIIGAGKGEAIAFGVFLPLLLEDLTPRAHVAWACRSLRAARTIGRGEAQSGQGDVQKASATADKDSVSVVESWVRGDAVTTNDLMYAVQESLREQDEAAYAVTSCARRAVAALFPAKATNQLAINSVQAAAKKMGGDESAKRDFWSFTLAEYVALSNTCGPYVSGAGDPIK